MNILVNSLVLVGLMSYLPSLGATPVSTPASAVRNYLAPCFEAGKGVNCEVSGVVRTGEHLVLANDKQMPKPGDPAIFTLMLDNHRIVGTPTYLEGGVLQRADKFEGLTSTQDGKYVIAITAFNKEGTAENASADALNTLLYWPVGEPGKAALVAPSARGQVTSSRGLRERIGKAVGSPYYQIEALSTAPDDRLLIGVRKYGLDSKAARYAFLLLSVPLTISERGIELGDEVETLWNLTPDQMAQALGLAAGSYPELGLSGIEFDRYNRDRFYAVTSYERDDKIGGFLWVLPLAEGKPGRPRPVRLEGGSVVAFSHKPEGVEVLDDHSLVIVHDDDRIRVIEPGTDVQRQEHEFAYSVVTFAQ